MLLILPSSPGIIWTVLVDKQGPTKHAVTINQPIHRDDDESTRKPKLVMMENPYKENIALITPVCRFTVEYVVLKIHV